jgi:hypothetical protein
MTDKKCWDRNSQRTSRSIFRISKLKEADKHIIFIFLFEKEKSSYKIENHFRMYRKYWYNFSDLKKINLMTKAL